LLKIVGDKFGDYVKMCICWCLLWTIKYHDDRLFLSTYIKYVWCEANPQWSVVDRLPICM